MIRCKDNSLLISIVILLVALIVASSYYVISNWMKEKKENDEFKNLENITQEVDENLVQEDKNNLASKEQNSTNKNSKSQSGIISYQRNLKALKSKNKDLVGWIKVDGTNIDYPVMQNGEYYLHYNFYKNKSILGTPFLQENCSIKTSDNLIIYGHHISSGKMFANLVNYKKYNYYKNHKYIKFSYLDGDVTKEDTYEICFVFKTTANVGGFKFNYYTNLKIEEDYNNFVKTCRNIEFYNTGVETKYGDKFITLVTCEYSQKNGRMVVIARKNKSANEVAK